VVESRAVMQPVAMVHTLPDSKVVGPRTRRCAPGPPDRDASRPAGCAHPAAMRRDAPATAAATGTAGWARSGTLHGSETGRSRDS